VEPEKLRHELGNLLSVALANVEGMIDGIVPPTPQRLDSVAQALREACKLVEQASEQGHPSTGSG
jgi:hypothetical protein